MPPLTEEQLNSVKTPSGAMVNANTGTLLSGPITSSALTPQQSYDFKSPQEPPLYPVAGLGSEQMAPTSQESKASDISTQLSSLNEQLIGESSYRAEKENEQGISDLQRTQTDLSARLTALKNEALAIPLQLQQNAAGKNITTGGLQPIQTAALRNNAIQALTTSSLLEASRGNMTLALDQVDRAVAQKYDPIREQIAARTKNLELILNDPLTSLQDKNRAARQKSIQDARLAEVAKQEETAKQIMEIALSAAARGADAMTLRNIQKSQDPVQAAAFAAPFIQKAEDGFTLSEGQTRYDAKGNIIAQAAPKGGKPADTGPILGANGEVLTYGTPEYTIERLKKTAGSKTKPVASEREQLGKFANVVALTESLMGSLDKTTNDPIIGYLRSLNPYDFDARAVNAQVTALVPSVARGLYGEVGVLTDSDIERYLKTLPNIRSTADQNKFIALMTLSNASRSYEQTLLNLANSNVNVSGFVDSYKALTDKISSIEKDLGVGGEETTADDEAIFDEVVGTKSGGNYFSRLWGAILGQ